MILIITHTQDYTVDYVANLLNKQEIPFFRLNTDLLGELDYTVKLNDHLQYNLAEKTEFTSLWFRRTLFTSVDNINSEIGNFLNLDYESFLFNLITSIKFERIISDPYNIYKAENKIYQLNVAKEIGFDIPITLLTNSKQYLIDFIKENQAIIKPIRNGKINYDDKNFLIYTNKLHISDVTDDVLLTPAIYQKEILKKYELRVTVVGNEVFAAKVDSQKNLETKLDWRRRKLLFQPYQLPNNISNLCLRLVNELGLNFGAIDLVYSQDNEYIFLEINPNGQWVWIETDTGLSISKKLITYLHGN